MSRYERGISSQIKANNSPKKCAIHRSIHLFPTTYLGSGHGSSRLSEVDKTSFSSHFIQQFLWDLEVFKARWDMLYLQRYNTLSSQLDASMRHPNQIPKPPQVAPFNAEAHLLYSRAPSRCLTSQPKSCYSDSSHPVKETEFGHTCNLSLSDTIQNTGIKQRECGNAQCYYRRQEG